MRYWVFTIRALEGALAAYEARRTREGATPEQLQEDRTAILNFLQGEEVRERKMIQDDGRG